MGYKFQNLLKALKFIRINEAFRKVKVCFFLSFSWYGNIWQLKATYGNFLQLMETFGNWGQLMATFGSLWQLIATIMVILAAFWGCMQVGEFMCGVFISTKSIFVLDICTMQQQFGKWISVECICSVTRVPPTFWNLAENWKSIILGQKYFKLRFFFKTYMKV